MAMQLDSVVPFGRSFDEYTKMFNLTEAELTGNLLSVADGPASFNTEGTQLGYRITSIDPLYWFTAAQIQQRFEQVVDHVIHQVASTPDDWVWSYHHSPAALRQNRERAIRLFCQDFDLGKRAGRYQPGELPNLPGANITYDLGLCSHFLFLYSDHFDQSFHLDSIRAMLCLCQEVRIFPLLTLGLQPSPYLGDVMATLTALGYGCDIQSVAYEFQRGGNKMLKITQPSP